MTDTQMTAVIETRLVRSLHRKGTSLPAEGEASEAALAEIRGVLVAQLREQAQDTFARLTGQTGHAGDGPTA